MALSPFLDWISDSKYLKTVIIMMLSLSKESGFFLEPLGLSYWMKADEFLEVTQLMKP